MIVAHSLGMTNGDYVFFYFEGFRGIEIGNIAWQKGDQNDNVNTSVCVFVLYWNKINASLFLISNKNH
jgi:hypothetical protein